MMSAIELKRLVSLIPDDAVVTIGGNPRVEITSVNISYDCDIVSARLDITPGWSITNDKILDDLMKEARAIISRSR